MGTQATVGGARPRRPRSRWVEVEGEPWLVERLSEALRDALAERGVRYHVRVEGVGRCGEVIVRITGAKGRLPMLFGRDELEPAFVGSLIRRTVEKYGL